MALIDKLKAVGNAIRAKTGKTAKLTLEQMRAEISGIKTVKEFLSARTVKFLFYGLNYTTIPENVVNMIDFSSIKDIRDLFNGCATLTALPQIDTSNATNAMRMCNGCTALTTVPQLDISNVNDTLSMFNGCSSLITIPLLNISKSANTYRMFSDCPALTTVPQLDMRSVLETGAMFNGCVALENCYLINIKVNLQVGSGSTWGHLLTLESLLHLIKELINVDEERTLTVGSANLAKLNGVYVRTIAITDEMRAEDEFIDQKAPFEVCESTDEGAVLISDYALLKNWTIK